MLCIVFLCLVVLASAQNVGYGQCYFPNGDYAANQHPCNLYSYVSFCCPTDWTCFSNSSCILLSPSAASPDTLVGTTRRGTCTNPGWDDTVCGTFCLNESSTEDGSDLTPCGQGRWCCSTTVADGSCDCLSGKGTFVGTSGSAVAVVAVVDGQFTTYAVSSQSMTTTETTSTSTLSSNATTTLSSSIRVSASTTAVPTSAEQHNKPDLSSKVLGPSIGFGILLLIILGATAWCFGIRRRRKRHRPVSPAYLTNTQTAEPLFGPPAPPAPVPHPYHQGYDIHDPPSESWRSDTELSQVMPDNNLVPVLDPYARAARRADSTRDWSSQERATRGSRRMIPRKPVPISRVWEPELPEE